MVREAFHEAARLFVQTVHRVPEGKWDAPGLGEWTVRELVGHTRRVLLTVENYAANPGTSPGTSVELPRPVDYFLRALSTLADPAAVAQRGRDAGKDLGAQPAATVQATADRVQSPVDQLPDATILATPVGGMKLVDYLPTRVLELTIHMLDIAAAVGAQVQPPAGPMKITLHLLADLSVARGAGPELALALTGRRKLPEGFALLG